MRPAVHGWTWDLGSKRSWRRGPWVGKFSSGRVGAVASQSLKVQGAGALGAALASTSKQFIVVTSHLQPAPTA
jgi:hypothetical protein